MGKIGCDDFHREPHPFVGVKLLISMCERDGRGWRKTRWRRRWLISTARLAKVLQIALVFVSQMGYNMDIKKRGWFK